MPSLVPVDAVVIGEASTPSLIPASIDGFVPLLAGFFTTGVTLDAATSTRCERDREYVENTASTGAVGVDVCVGAATGVIVGAGVAMTAAARAAASLAVTVDVVTAVVATTVVVVVVVVAAAVVDPCPNALFHWLSVGAFAPPRCHARKSLPLMAPSPLRSGDVAGVTGGVDAVEVTGGSKLPTSGNARSLPNSA